MQEQKGNRDRWKEVKSKENWDKAVSWINDKKEDEPISIILIFQILWNLDYNSPYKETNSQSV